MKKLLTILAVTVIAVLFFIDDKDIWIKEDPFDQAAKAMIVMNADTGKVLYENNAKEALPIASMSKLMTQLLVLEAIAEGRMFWDSLYSPSTAVLNLPSNAAKLGMQADKTYTAKELFTAMTIVSGNDAAIALAEMVSGSEEAFVEDMNKTAKRLKLADTNFINASGLDEDTTNSATARDVAKIARTLIDNHPEILEFASMNNFTTSEGMKRWSTNQMLPGMPSAMTGIDGLKTGYTKMAGRCFAGTGVYDGERFITVVIGAVENDTTDARFDLTRELINTYVTKN